MTLPITAPGSIVERQLLDFFQARCFAVDQLNTESDLLASGVIDSLSVMDLVIFLESQYSVELTPADLRPDNFRTLARITALVHAKTSDMTGSDASAENQALASGRQ